MDIVDEVSGPRTPARIPRPSAEDIWEGFAQGWLSWAGVPTVLVMLSSAFSTIGAFQSSDRRFRQLLMVSTLLMIVHNLLVFTPAGVFLELFFLASNLVGYYRHYVRGRLLPGNVRHNNPKP